VSKKIVILPAEYPTKDNPLAGIFTKDQVNMFANNGHDVAVAYNYFISLKKIRFKNILNFFLKKKIKKSKNITEITNSLFSTFFHIFKLQLDYYLTKKFLIEYINKKGKPDLIICHFAFPTGNTAMKILREFNIPYIVVEHSTGYFTGLYNNFQIKVIKKALNRSSLIVAVSSFLKKKLVKLTNTKVLTIGNIVDKKFFLLKKKKLNKNKLNFLIISELVKKKQVLNLVKIFKELDDENIKFQLRIVGDGPEYTSILNYVIENNMRKNILILGIKNKKQISNLFDKTDYLVSCSKVETFGITVAESIAKGVPTIVLDSGGPNDFINKSNSYSVTSFNNLKNKIKNIINKPKKFNKKIMRSFIYNRFSEKILIKKYDELIKEVIKWKY
jgi:glycosyltransferase involved in cell wall biosynthesis